MKDVLSDLVSRWEAGETVGVATVVETFRSAPRLAGASMLTAADGQVLGSVSGGCVDADVYLLAQEVAASGTPVLRRYGISDDEAFAVGLTCGGALDVFVEAVGTTTFPELGSMASEVRAGVPVAVATVVSRPDPARVGRRMSMRSAGAAGSLGSARLDGALGRDALEMLAGGRSGVLTYGHNGRWRTDAVRVSLSPSRRGRGCWCSARWTSPPHWSEWDACSITMSPSATRVRCLRTASVSPR